MHNFHGIDDRMHHHRFRRKKPVDHVGDKSRENHAGNEEEDFAALFVICCVFLRFHDKFLRKVIMMGCPMSDIPFSC